MAVFEKAPFDKENTTQTLKPGRYFIDNDYKDLFNLSEYGGAMEGSFVKALEFFPPEDIVNILHSGRGDTMIEFDIKEEVVVPREVLLATTHFYILPPGVSLGDAQRKLYGTLYDEPRGFWEWLHHDHPIASKHLLNIAEGVVDTGKSILTNTNEVSKTIIMVGGAIVVVMVLFKLIKKG